MLSVRVADSLSCVPVDTSVVHGALMTSIGTMIVTASSRGVTGIHFIDQTDLPVCVRQWCQSRSLPVPATLGSAAHTMYDGKRLAQLRVMPVIDQAELWTAVVHVNDCLIPEKDLSDASDTPAHDFLGQALDELTAYFQGTLTRFNTPLDLSCFGSPFQLKVWRAMVDIPLGQLLTYGQLALEAGLQARHVRAVGAAVGRNPISIMIPCHRVVGHDRRLTGYSGGLHRKYALLQLEGMRIA